MLTTLLIVAAIVPLAMAIFGTWLSWTSLPQPWLYLTVSLVGLYTLTAFLLVRLFSTIGISGTPSRAPKTFIGSIESDVLLAIGIVVVLGGVAMWGFRFLVAKA